MQHVFDTPQHRNSKRREYTVKVRHTREHVSHELTAVCARCHQGGVLQGSACSWEILNLQISVRYSKIQHLSARHGDTLYRLLLMHHDSFSLSSFLSFFMMATLEPMAQLQLAANCVGRPQQL